VAEEEDRVVEVVVVEVVEGCVLEETFGAPGCERTKNAPAPMTTTTTTTPIMAAVETPERVTKSFIPSCTQS